METLPTTTLTRIPDPSDFQRAMMEMMPPLKKRQNITQKTNQMIPDNAENIQNVGIPSAIYVQQPQIKFASVQQMMQGSPQQQIMQQQYNNQDLALQQKLDHKERNRLAAQKWRAKKDECLSTLEEENDVLRKKVFDLQAQALQLSTENNVLESELLYFQQFMARIMNTPKK